MYISDLVKKKTIKHTYAGQTAKCTKNKGSKLVSVFRKHASQITKGFAQLLSHIY